MFIRNTTYSDIIESDDTKILFRLESVCTLSTLVTGQEFREQRWESPSSLIGTAIPFLAS